MLSWQELIIMSVILYLPNFSIDEVKTFYGTKLNQWKKNKIIRKKEMYVGNMPSIISVMYLRIWFYAHLTYFKFFKG